MILSSRNVVGTILTFHRIALIGSHPLYECIADSRDEPLSLAESRILEARPRYVAPNEHDNNREST